MDFFSFFAVAVEFRLKWKIRHRRENPHSNKQNAKRDKQKQSQLIIDSKENRSNITYNKSNRGSDSETSTHEVIISLSL